MVDIKDECYPNKESLSIKLEMLNDDDETVLLVESRNLLKEQLFSAIIVLIHTFIVLKFNQMKA